MINDDDDKSNCTPNKEQAHHKNLCTCTQNKFKFQHIFLNLNLEKTKETENVGNNNVKAYIELKNVRTASR